MFKSFRNAGFATLAIAQSDPGTAGRQVPLPKVVPSRIRPVSGVDVWRYDQSPRLHGERPSNAARENMAGTNRQCIHDFNRQRRKFTTSLSSDRPQRN